MELLGQRVYIFFWLLLHVICLLSQKVLKVIDFYVLRPVTSHFSFSCLLTSSMRKALFFQTFLEMMLLSFLSRQILSSSLNLVSLHMSQSLVLSAHFPCWVLHGMSLLLFACLWMPSPILNSHSFWFCLLLSLALAFGLQPCLVFISVHNLEKTNISQIYDFCS